MTREDAKRKVRALRNTAAPGSGATDPERATAARLADRLEEEHGLDSPTRVQRERGGGGSFTVHFGASQFASAFHYTDEDIAAAMRLNEAEMERFEEKRRRFRDILSGRFP